MPNIIYKELSDKIIGCAILILSISVPEDEVLDLETIEMKYAFRNKSA